MSRRIEDTARRRPRQTRISLGQGLQGVAMVAGLALAAGLAGWVLALLVSWIY